MPYWPFAAPGFHGTLTELGQTADIVGVYAALLALIGYAVTEFLSLDDNWPGWAVMAALLLLALLAGVTRNAVDLFDSDVFTPLLVAIISITMLAIGVRVLVRKQPAPPRVPLWTSLVGVVGAGGAALLFKFTDGTDNLWAKHQGNVAECAYGPGSVVQGHALWHVLSALMFLCMFEFLRLLRQPRSSVLPWVD